MNKTNNHTEKMKLFFIWVPSFLKVCLEQIQK